MIKLILLGAILYVIYVVFFKNKSTLFSSTEEKREKDKDAQTVVECHECKTYVSVDEAMLVDGKYFCSKECVDAYNRS